MASSDGVTLEVLFEKDVFTLALQPSSTLGEVAARLHDLTGTSTDAMKFVLKGSLMKPAEHPALPVRDTGLSKGGRVLLLASRPADILKIQEARDLPGLANFDRELRILEARRKYAQQQMKPPTGTHAFQGFQAWEASGLRPPPSEALKLLHSLASDAGIVSILRKHGWGPKLLSEMPPEGKVGVSPVCILGVNINAGQEISLRLRTDDLAGFRRYAAIRETLCHELAHMVHGDHDWKFKELNSQLLRECLAAQPVSGRRLDGASIPPEEADHAHRPAAATPPRGMRLGSGDSGDGVAGVRGIGHRDARTEAAEAAARRLGAPDPTLKLAELPPAAPRPAPAVGAAEDGAAGLEAASSLAFSAMGKERLAGGKAHESEPASGDVEPAGGSESALGAALARFGAGPGAARASGAAEALATVLQNVLDRPGEVKYRRLRERNAAVQERVLRWTGARDVLLAAGFQSADEGGDPTLLLQRHDEQLLRYAVAALRSGQRPH